MSEVIILGCGPTHVECKYHCETWGVNGTYTFAQRLDKLFMTDEAVEVNATHYEIQKMRELNPVMVFPVDYEKFRGNGFKVEIYPIERVQERFPTRFFSNTIAYMIAYALVNTKTIQDSPRPRVVDGYNRILLYGIDMMTHSTYVQEKGGVEYWMGVALGMGVEVTNTKGSATGKTWNGRMYGYWGQLQEEMLKERLMAPWEIIKGVSKSEAVPAIEDEWTQSGQDWIKVPQ